MLWACYLNVEEIEEINQCWTVSFLLNRRDKHIFIANYAPEYGMQRYGTYKNI